MDGLVGSEIKPDPSLPHCDYQPFRLGGGVWIGWGGETEGCVSILILQ